MFMMVSIENNNFMTNPTRSILSTFKASDVPSTFTQAFTGSFPNFDGMVPSLLVNNQVVYVQDSITNQNRTAAINLQPYVMTGYSRARAILTTNREALVRIAEALLVREVVDGSEIKLLIDGKPLPERVRVEPPKPPETTEVLKPQPATGLPGRERPQPA